MGFLFLGPAWVLVCISVFEIRLATAQDCLFYHFNSSEQYTTAFVAVDENAPVGSVIARADARVALRIVLRPIDNEVADQLFEILIRNNATVELIVRQPLTHLLPITKSLYFNLQCTGPSGAYSSLPFLVTIKDINDHAPAFEKDWYETTISEFHTIGQPVVGPLKAYDGDLPNTPNTELQYTIISSDNSTQYFAIRNPLEPVISLIRKLDYETGPKEYHLNVSVSDRGEPPLSNLTTVVIHIRDEDDRDPIFPSSVYHASITEEIDAWMDVIRVKAWDGDVGLNETLKYEIIDGTPDFIEHFSVNDTTGVILLQQPVDREQLPSSADGFITLTVQASQVNDASRRARSIVKIRVDDINDNGPQFHHTFIKRRIDIVPSILSSDLVEIAQLSVSDRDTPENSAFTCFVDSPLNESFSLQEFLVLDPSEGRNQAILLKASNISSLVLRFGTEVVIRVVATDSTRNRRDLRSYRNVTDEPASDTATIHLTFNQVYPSPILSRDYLRKLPADAKLFMEQYNAGLLVLFGGIICILLLVVALMAAAVRHLRRQLRVNSFSISMAGSFRSQRTFSVAPLSLLTSCSESHA